MREDTVLENSTLTPSTPSGAGQADAAAAKTLVAMPIGDVERSVDEWAYPPLGGDDTDLYFREGRPLDMCPHGHVNRAGDYCPICD